MKREDTMRWHSLGWLILTTSVPQRRWWQRSIRFNLPVTGCYQCLVATLRSLRRHNSWACHQLCSSGSFICKAFPLTLSFDQSLRVASSRRHAYCPLVAVDNQTDRQLFFAESFDSEPLFCLSASTVFIACLLACCSVHLSGMLSAPTLEIQRLKKLNCLFTRETT